MTRLIIEQISAREAGEISHMCFLKLLPMQAFAFIGFWLYTKVPPVILYYWSFQCDTSVAVLTVLCHGVDFCAVSALCTFSYFS